MQRVQVDNYLSKVPKAHIDRHFEELKYRCNICEKRFKWRQQLKRHCETDRS